MGLFLANGTRRTKAALVTTSISDPEVKINEDLYETTSYGKNDPKPEGSILTLKLKAGTVVRQSYIDNVLFAPGTVTGRSPSTNVPAAGGTVLTITGTGLDGITAVTFGGTAGTSLVIDSSTQLRITTPAKSAGTYDVVFTDAEGTITKTGFIVYA